MGPQQISTIQKVLMSSSNLLVWGLGNDSPYWNNCTKGRVVFLEDGISYGKHGVYQVVIAWNIVKVSFSSTNPYL
jgi:hypothetical protein